MSLAETMGIKESANEKEAREAVTGPSGQPLSFYAFAGTSEVPQKTFLAFNIRLFEQVAAALVVCLQRRKFAPTEDGLGLVYIFPGPPNEAFEKLREIEILCQYLEIANLL